MDLNFLIGLEEQTAKQFLMKNGYNNIETIINSRNNEKCDALIVCAVKVYKNKISLICGEFHLNLKEK